jgi:tetratricopeptide (TPR) repeat protein
LLRFTADDNRLQTFELDDGRLRAWQPATAAALGAERLLHPGTKAVRAAFHPDGTRLLVGHVNGDVQQWDATTGGRVGPPMANPAPVRALAYSRDGKTLAVAGGDGTARLWDAATAAPLGPRLGHRFPIVGLTFSDGDRALLCTTTDGATTAWKLAAPVTGDTAALDTWLQALSAERLTDNGMAPLDNGAWRRLSKHPARVALAQGSSGRRAEWHDARSREAEADGDLTAARWHLDRLIAARPRDWMLYARRARWHANAGRFDQADADHARAAERHAGGALADWYRHEAAECQVRESWAVALWYLDRALRERPADWQGYAARATVHERLARPAQRDADLVNAVDNGAEPDTVLRLAEIHAAAGRWPEAAAIFARGHQRGAVPLAVSYRHALTCLKAGDQAGYQKVCADLVRVAGAKADPRTANTVAMACALGPDAVADWQPVLSLMERAVAALPPPGQDARPEVARVRHAFLNTLGAVLHRAGRTGDAVDRLAEAAATTTADFHDGIFLAMAHQALGNAPEARRWLDRAGKAMPPPVDQFSWESVERQLLYEEARRLVQPSEKPRR